MPKIHIEKGDITEKRVDAIVNAANSELQLGSGVAGAIRKRGGPEIQKECDNHGPINVGEAAITGAGMLPARYVIHQASMPLGGRATAETLRDSTRAVLEIAEDYGLKTLAFPATGTGVAGIRPRLGAAIMLETVWEHLSGETSLTDVTFVLFDDETYEIFRQTYEQIGR